MGLFSRGAATSAIAAAVCAALLQAHAVTVPFSHPPLEGRRPLLDRELPASHAAVAGYQRERFELPAAKGRQTVALAPAPAGMGEQRPAATRFHWLGIEGAREPRTLVFRIPSGRSPPEMILL